MTSISNVDQVMLLLRQRLRSLSDNKNVVRKSKIAAERSEKSSVKRVKALVMLKEMPEKDFERTFIQGLLTDEFGEAMINDPKFQEIVDRVLNVIHSDQKSSALLKEASNQLINQT